MSDPVFEKERQLVDAQVAILRRGGGLSAGEIHDLRVLTKQLRGCLRLYGPVREKSAINQVDQAMKTIAGSFAGMRDSHVQVKMLDKILRGQPHIMLQTQRLYEDLEHGRSVGALPDLSVVEGSFKHALSLWEHTLACDDSAFVDQGLKATYEKSRKLGKRALKKNIDELFHEWRKFEKYWLYQLNIIAMPRSRKGRKYVEELSELGSKLGRFNDFCVFEFTVSKHSALFEDARAADLILGRIEEQKVKLKRYFASSYSRLYSDGFDTCWRKKLDGPNDATKGQN